MAVGQVSPIDGDALDFRDTKAVRIAARTECPDERAEQLFHGMMDAITTWLRQAR
ncbi:hypothetical protein [Ancylobacter radicis]|uniref:Uncharacterized protein n=1 Tax=Ancylobacter radicis TaxID=2836179 RepID=A0ABS5RBG0_9HYPH|nr:hypothetical protein [Ancylobacter radicis]MBS9478991.1 hypothetical protein [Ancylobacter radicis]